jgi:hypothetical protein
MEGQGRHLHLDDYPKTLELLGALVGQRGDRDRLGYTPTEHGAWVDWEALTTGVLSSTEVATVRIAQGCATLERAGGLPTRLADAVVATVEAVAGVRRGKRDTA